MNKQRYIIRADRAGVFYGEIAERRGGEVDLLNCRRLHGWSKACSLSQLAVDGERVGDNTRFSVVVPSMTVLGVIEVIPCSDKAMASIDAVPIWAI